jgi:hypothetical protein
MGLLTWFSASPRVQLIWAECLSSIVPERRVSRSGLDSTATRIIDGTVASGRFGTAVDIGDTNGDEVEDLAISGQGSAYIFHGAAANGVIANCGHLCVDISDTNPCG